MKSLIRDIIIVLVIVLAITFFIKPIIVKKTSMEPTLHENNYIFINKQAYTLGEPKNGDIVVFPYKGEGVDELYIKRVIGLPGDKITIENGSVYINGKMQDEDYTMSGVTDGDVKNFTVPEDKLFVLGDNREVSIDSRYEEIGCVPIDDVTGKAFLRLYPFSEFGLL